MKNPLVAKLELEFGNDIWKPVTQIDYAPTKQDINTLFDIFNKHFFNNKIVKMPFVIKPLTGNALAAFSFGSVRGMPVHMEVFNNSYSSFFQFMNSVAHEMIHAYDWTVGPLHKMIYEFFDYVAFDPKYIARSRNMVTQVVFDPRYHTVDQAISAKAKTYDVHGRWFNVQAQKFNQEGFDVHDVLIPQLRKPRFSPNMTEDIDEMPIEDRHINDMSVIKHLYDTLDSEYKRIKVINKKNWMIEII